MAYDAEVETAVGIAAENGSSGTLSVLSGDVCLGYVWLAEVVIGEVHRVRITKSGVPTKVEWRPVVGEPGEELWDTREALRPSDTVECLFIAAPQKDDQPSFLGAAWRRLQALIGKGLSQ